VKGISIFYSAAAAAAAATTAATAATAAAVVSVAVEEEAKQLSCSLYLLSACHIILHSEATRILAR
jgi:hypothetical protein